MNQLQVGDLGGPDSRASGDDLENAERGCAVAMAPSALQLRIHDEPPAKFNM